MIETRAPGPADIDAYKPAVIAAPVDLAGFAVSMAIVTLGNVAGGAGGVALAYWTACGRYRAD